MIERTPTKITEPMIDHRIGKGSPWIVMVRGKGRASHRAIQNPRNAPMIPITEESRHPAGE
jgi:hypothetical protein